MRASLIDGLHGRPLPLRPHCVPAAVQDGEDAPPRARPPTCVVGHARHISNVGWPNKLLQVGREAHKV